MNNNILIIINSYSKSMETFIYNHIEMLSNDPQYNITVLCHSLPEKDFNINKKIHVIHSGLNRKKKRIYSTFMLFLIDFKTFFKLSKYKRMTFNLSLYSVAYKLHNLNFDIIHAHFGHNGRLIAPLIDSGILKAKLITQFHGLDLTDPKCKSVDYYSCLKQNISIALGSTFYSGKLIKDLGFSNISLIPVGTDRRLFCRKTLTNESKKNSFNILFIGRLIELKGVLLLPKISRTLFNLGVRDFNFYIIGDGILKNELEALIQSEGVNIKLLGYKSSEHIKQYLENSDVLIYPGYKDNNGREENQCLAIQEAMFMKLPIVASNVGGVSESIIEGKTGFVVEQKDIDGFADRLHFLYKYPEIRIKMGVAGYEYAKENYDLEITSCKIDNLYKKISNACI